MKTKTRFPWFVFGLSLVLFGGGFVKTGSPATLDQVRGDVQVVPALRAGGPPGWKPDGKSDGKPSGLEAGRPVSAGAAVSPGESVRVGPESHARLQLPDGTQVEIFARTELLFNEDLSDPDARGHLLGLIWGRILSRVVPRKEGGAPYKVVTPATVCGVRGTEFVVAVADDGETRVGVEKGEVEVTGTDGSERLSAGTETRVLVGQRPLRPVQALLEKIDWEGWINERNQRLREKLAERVALLNQTARAMDARLDQINRRLQKVEADARELARKRLEAGEQGDWGRFQELGTQLKTKLDEGVEVCGLAAETQGRRIVAFTSGERALQGVAGPGVKLQGRLQKLAGDLDAFRASLAEKAKADQEVYGRRIQTFHDLFQDYGRKAQELLGKTGTEQQLLERWNKLSPEKQEELKRKYEQWKGLSEETRKKVLDNWDRFQKMSQSERREIMKNLREFERLGLAEKVRIKEHFEHWRSLTPERREEIKRKFRKFKALSPEEREAVLERIRDRGQSGPRPPGR